MPMLDMGYSAHYIDIDKIILQCKSHLKRKFKLK